MYVNNFFRVENIITKGEIAHYKLFLFLLQYFRGIRKFLYVQERVNADNLNHTNQLEWDKTCNAEKQQ